MMEVMIDSLQERKFGSAAATKDWTQSCLWVLLSRLLTVERSQYYITMGSTYTPDPYLR